MAALSVQRTGDGTSTGRPKDSPADVILRRRAELHAHAANHGNGFRPRVLGGTHRLAHKRIDNGFLKARQNVISVRFPTAERQVAAKRSHPRKTVRLPRL